MTFALVAPVGTPYYHQRADLSRAWLPTNHHPPPPSNPPTFHLPLPQLILPFALAFFLGAYIAYKRQLLFVYEPEFESGGTFFAKAYRRMVAALYLMQLALLCVLITNEAFTEIAWLAPLPVLTFLGSLVITRSYHDAAAQLPLSVAMESDEINRAYGETYSFLNHSYIQPALQPLARRGGVPASKPAAGPAASAAVAAPASQPQQQRRQQQQQQGQQQGQAAAQEEEEDDPFSTYLAPRAATPPAPAPASTAAPPSESGDAARESETKQMEEGSGAAAVAVDAEARW